MQSIVRFYRGIDIVAVGVSTIVCAYITSIKELFTLSPKLIILIPLMLAIAKLFSWIGAVFFERITFLRKMYFGNDYIEGAWLGNIDPNGFSLTRISFNRSGITVTGEQFDKEGKRVWRWSSIGSGTFSDSNLLYFSNNYDNSNKNPILGISNMTVHDRQGKIPYSLVGYWSDINSTLKESFHAPKITERNQLKILNKEGSEVFIRKILKNI